MCKGQKEKERQEKATPLAYSVVSFPLEEDALAVIAASVPSLSEKA